MKTWSWVVQELLALHEIFRTLGFPAEELFVAPYGNGRVQFLLHHSGRELTVDVGVVQDSKELAREWSEAVMWWNKEAAEEEERMQLYDNSSAKKNAVGLITALTARGITPIRGESFENRRQGDEGRNRGGQGSSGSALN